MSGTRSGDCVEDELSDVAQRQCGRIIGRDHTGVRGWLQQWAVAPYVALGDRLT
jgi:hypothetical protein